MMPSLSVVIVSYNTSVMLRQCLAAVIDKGASVAEIVVVDNNSSDDSVAMVRREFPSVHLIAQPINSGFGAANNVGVNATTSAYTMLLNSDAILIEDTGAGLVGFLEDHANVGCVGPRIILPNGERQPRVFGNQPSLWRIAMQSLSLDMLLRVGSLFEGTDIRERPGPEDKVGWISGVCMVMRRVDFVAVGGFDPDFFMYCEDIDLCARLARRGGDIVRLDRLAVRHYGGASSPSVAAQIRNAVWVQRNLLKIVHGRSKLGTAYVARMMLSIGLLLRIGAGLALLPRRGLRGNLLLRTSWIRLRDLVAPLATIG